MRFSPQIPGVTAALLTLTATFCCAPIPVRAQTSTSDTKTAPHPIAIMKTDKGTIRIELYPEEAPKTVENFISLTKKGFYNGLTFHRVEPGFVIQGGDPSGNGTGGPGYTIPDEKNKTLTHKVGAVAMAKTAAPNSAGSQFYIVIEKPADFLNNNYTVFGQVIEGQAVAEKIAVGDKMTEVTIVEPTKPVEKTVAPPAPVPAPPANRDAEVVERLLPDIPKSLWTAKYNRSVKVRVDIAADGHAKTELAKGSGNDEVDYAVLATLRRWRWKPALKEGKPVATRTEFDLKLGTE